MPLARKMGCPFYLSIILARKYVILNPFWIRAGFEYRPSIQYSTTDLHVTIADPPTLLRPHWAGTKVTIANLTSLVERSPPM